MNEREIESVKCHWKCPTAKSKKCWCRCSGENHGKARKPWPQLELIKNEEEPMFEPRRNFITGHMASRSVWIHEHLLDPGQSQKVYNHSPDGFCWGYGGSGPSQLALALMLVYEPSSWTMEHYQDFKWDMIVKLPQGDFQIQVSTVTDWIKNKKACLAPMPEDNLEEQANEPSAAIVVS